MAMFNMKLHNIFLLMLLFNFFTFSQMDTIPTQFYGVAENESYTYISTNTGLYILERDSNNVFGEIYNVQDSLGLLHTHNNYLISGNEYKLKVFDITQPANPLICQDTLMTYPVSEFEDFNNYFVIRLDLGGYEDKFLIADIIDDNLQVLFDSDLANPTLSNIRRGSEFYYPYAFLCFDDLIDTIWVYRYDLVQNNFNRMFMYFPFQQYFSGISAYNDLLYTADSYIDPFGQPHYNQWQYYIDTTTNTFTLLNTWHIFGTGPDDMNSFTILSFSQTPWAAKKYDFTSYEFNMPNGYWDVYFLTDSNLYWAQNYIPQGPQSLYYTRRAHQTV